MDVIDAPVAPYGDFPPPRSRESCEAVGLDCNECVQNTAKHLAEICPAASPAAAQKLFTVLYPDACCAPMGLAFIRAYRVANEPNHNVAFHAA